VKTTNKEFQWLIDEMGKPFAFHKEGLQPYYALKEYFE
jgi:hypothetical protein